MSARIEKGKRLVDELRMPEAVRHFEALLANPAEQTDAHLWLGKLRIASGELEEAEAHLKAVLQRNPRHAEALALKGVIALRSGNPEEAIRFLEDANRLDANLLVTHMNLTASYRQLNRLPESLRAAREAIKHYRENPQAHVELARTLWQMDKKPEALQAAVQALDFDYAFLPAYLELANWLISEDQLDAAVVILQQGLAILPQNCDLRAQLSHVYLEAVKVQEAIAEARLVVSQRGWPQDHAHLAVCLSAASDKQGRDQAFETPVRQFLNPKQLSLKITSAG
jgi:tetratricopeptide (TPR) repeat protein